MSYTAKSLDEIAQLFDQRAHNVWRRHGPGDVREAATWLLAADILRRTTITEPIHMEKQ